MPTTALLLFQGTTLFATSASIITRFFFQIPSNVKIPTTVWVDVSALSLLRAIRQSLSVVIIARRLKTTFLMG